MAQIETQEFVTGLHSRHKYGHVGLCSRVGLHIGVFSSEDFFETVYGKLFGFIYHLTTAIVAVAGITLGIFVGQA